MVLSVLAAWMAIELGWFDRLTGYRFITLYEEGFSNLEVWNPRAEFKDGPWQRTPDGLALPSGRSGVVSVRVPMPADDTDLLVFAAAGGATERRATLGVSSDGKEFRIVANQVQVKEMPVVIPHEDRLEGEALWIRLRVEGMPGVLDDGPLTLSSVRVLGRRPPVAFPDVPLASLLILTPMLAATARKVVEPRNEWRVGLAVLGGMVLMAAMNAVLHDGNPQRFGLYLAEEYDLYFFVPYCVLLGIVAWHWRIGNGAGVTVEARWGRFALAGSLAWAGSNRLYELMNRGWSPLDPDVIYYRSLAQAMTAPYDTGSREPLWIWILKGWFSIAGDSPLASRLLTVLLSLVVIVIAYKFIRDYTGSPILAAGVSWLLATNTYLDWLSARGLRAEVYMIAVLGVAYFALVHARPLSPAKRIIGFSLAGAAAQLVRFNSVVFLIPLGVMLAWRLSRRWTLVFVPLVVLAVVSVPHLVHNQQEFDDPLYSLTHLAIWARNYEFVALKKVGCEGCPTDVEFARDGYSGTPIGTLDYLFGMHTLQELVTKTIEGYRMTYLEPSPLWTVQTSTSSLFFYGLYMVGLGRVVLGPYRELLLVMLLVVNVLPFFLMLGYEARVSVQTVPFASFILVVGVWSVFQVACEVANRLPSRVLLSSARGDK